MQVLRRVVGTRLTRSLPLVYACLICGVVVPGGVAAQARTTGSLGGAVTSRSGDVIIGASVRATSAALQGAREALTGPTGRYQLEGLAPGVYTIRFASPGMASEEHRKTVPAGVAARLDAQLRQTDFDATIIVTGESSIIADSSTIGAVIDAQAIHRLPIGRTLSEIAELSPAVARSRAPGAPLSLAGASGRDNLWLIDGAGLSDALAGSELDMLVPDALIQVRVAAAGLSPEVGRFGGGVIGAVTHSGGDEVHGSGRVLLSSPSWRSETPYASEASTRREDSTQLNAEATLGGFFHRDRLWFFAAALSSDAAAQTRREGADRDEEHDDERLQLKLTGRAAPGHGLTLNFAAADRRGVARPGLRSPRPVRVIPFGDGRDVWTATYGGVVAPNVFVEATASRARAHTLFDVVGLSDSIVEEEEWSGSVTALFDTGSAGSHDLVLGAEDFEGSIRGVEGMFVSDSWRVDRHWTLNLGLRREEVSGRDEAGRGAVSRHLLPRLAAAFDVRGNGSALLEATFGEYAGVWDRDPLAVRAHGASHKSATAPPNTGIVREWTLSSGVRVGAGGHFSVAYIDRQWTDVVVATVLADNGSSMLAGGALVDRVVYRPSAVPQRSYESLVVHGRFPRSQRWALEGHWTRQLHNSGNSPWPGESSLSGSPLRYPEIRDARTDAYGPIPSHQRDRVRLWTTYRRDRGIAGVLSLSAILSYDSARHFSLVEMLPLTETQRTILAQLGYGGSPAALPLFYGNRGGQQFDSSRRIDFALLYDLPLPDPVDVWLKAEVFNVLDDDSLLSWDTTVHGVDDGKLDELGRPTAHVRDPSFGTARGPEDYETPRELRVSLGVRF
ncbi:MAG: TonB-dependent receptor [Acidobacteriota bacterium]|nr:TonB-dependent receptor [Acidobacteriota bacterium]